MKTFDPHKTVTETRQADRRLDNFWVLILSIIGIVVLFAVIYFAYATFSPPPPGV